MSVGRGKTQTGLISWSHFRGALKFAIVPSRKTAGLVTLRASRVNTAIERPLCDEFITISIRPINPCPLAATGGSR